MNNASHIFDQFAVIFQEGKRKDCLLSDDGIKEMCMHFREVYVLWDGAFSLALKFAPTDEDCKRYCIAGQYDTAMLHYTKDAFDAEACQMADEEYTRWVGR